MGLQYPSYKPYAAVKKRYMMNVFIASERLFLNFFLQRFLHL